MPTPSPNLGHPSSASESTSNPLPTSSSHEDQIHVLSVLKAGEEEEEVEEEEEEEECDVGFRMIANLSKEIAIQHELQEWVRELD